MKTKINLLLILLCAILLMMPIITLGAYDSTFDYKFEGGWGNYAINMNTSVDNTAQLLSIGSALTIPETISYMSEPRTVTSIKADAFSDEVIQNLGMDGNINIFIASQNALELVGTDAEVQAMFDNIEYIYITPDAQGYTAENGWPINKIKTYVEYNSTKYEIYKEANVNKAKVVAMNVHNDGYGSIYIKESVEANGETYNVTSISKDALFQITAPRNPAIRLQISGNTAPELETTNGNEFFKYIERICIYPDATGYDTSKWPQDKLNAYEIRTQPHDITIQAGDNSSMPNISADAYYAVEELNQKIPQLPNPDSRWYICDEQGKIAEGANAYDHIYELLNDLPYDFENNTSKDHYVICEIGKKDSSYLEYSRVVKITVNPGVYTVMFWRVPWDGNNPIIKQVNSERKITDAPALADLEQAGKQFVGWEDETGNMVNLSTTAFTKNTILYPVWETKIKLNANGRTFTDGTTEKEFIVKNSMFDYELLENLLSEKNIREFRGITDAKTNGVFIDEYEKILEEKTFYIQWGYGNNVVLPDGTTIAPISDDITWVREEADGESIWFGLDNSNGTFEEGTVFWVQLISKNSNPDIWEEYFNKIDENIRKQLKEEKLKIALIKVTDENGDEYIELPSNVKLYVQCPDSWNTEGLQMIYIGDNSDEALLEQIITGMNYPEGTDDFLCVDINHFSPYAIYDTTEDVNLDGTQDDLKGEGNGDSNASKENPKTGDNILLFVGLFAISALGIFITTKFTKKNKK